MAEDTDFTGNLIWFLAGASLGAAIALLYAPASGEETRRYIAKKTQEGREAISETSRDLADRGRNLYEKGRKIADDAADLFDRGKQLLQNQPPAQPEG